MALECSKPASRNINTGLRFEIWRQPCAVCGTPYHIKCDHIVPWSKGGKSTKENLQPLCHDCNHYKHNHRSNTDVANWVVGKGINHFLKSVFDEDTKYFNQYDGPSIECWAAHNPDRVAFARELHAAFLRGRLG